MLKERERITNALVTWANSFNRFDIDLVESVPINEELAAEIALTGNATVAVDPNELILTLTHPNNSIDGKCSECETPLHRCDNHNQFACRRTGIVTYVEEVRTVQTCMLCFNCFSALGHRHCHGCSLVRNGEWLCENCGRSDCCREMSSDSAYCSACYDATQDNDNDNGRINDNDSVIKGYHEYTLPTARPAMKNGEHNGKPYLWLGVELEAEMEHGHSRDDAAEAVDAAFGESVVLAFDCSLNSGFETITGPLSLSEHEILWPKLAPTMAKNGLRSWGHSTAGMHIHASRNFFTQLQIGKMLVFLNSGKTRDNVVKLAGRNSEQFATLHNKKLADVNQNFARHEALNLTNDATIEFRIFKGTLKTGHILANIEFVHALSMYVQDASIRVMEDWPLFMRWVIRHESTYRNLVAFFALDLEKMEAA